MCSGGGGGGSDVQHPPRHCIPGAAPMNTTLSIRYRLLFLVCHPGWSDHRSISYPPPMERDAPVGRPLSLPPPACVPLRYQLPTLTTCIFKSDGTLVRLSLPRGKKRREERTQTRGDAPDADTRGWLPAMCIPPPRRARRRCVFTCRRHNDHTLGLKCIFVMCGAWRGPGGGGKRVPMQGPCHIQQQQRRHGDVNRHPNPWDDTWASDGPRHRHVAVGPGAGSGPRPPADTFEAAESPCPPRCYPGTSNLPHPYHKPQTRNPRLRTQYPEP
jgi:hypothetical protein